MEEVVEAVVAELVLATASSVVVLVLV